MVQKKESKDFQSSYNEYKEYIKAGKIAIAKKEYIKAIDNYSKAIELSPFESSHYYYRGLAWYKKGNRKRAVEDFTKAVLLDSKSSSAYIYRGLCRMEEGEYREALSDFKMALERDPKNAGIHNNLAWLYITAQDEKYQDKRKALEHAKKAAEFSQEKNAEILDTLAQAYFINGKVKEALETERKALTLEPTNGVFSEKVKQYENSMGNER